MPRVKPPVIDPAPPRVTPSAPPKRKPDPLAEPQAAAAWAMPERPSRRRLLWRKLRGHLRLVATLILVIGAAGGIIVSLQHFGRGADLPERDELQISG